MYRQLTGESSIYVNYVYSEKIQCMHTVKKSADNQKGFFLLNQHADQTTVLKNITKVDIG